MRHGLDEFESPWEDDISSFCRARMGKCGKTSKKSNCSSVTDAALFKKERDLFYMQSTIGDEDNGESEVLKRIASLGLSELEGVEVLGSDKEDEDEILKLEDESGSSFSSTGSSSSSSEEDEDLSLIHI